MNRFVVLLVFLITVLYTHTVIAQEHGYINRGSQITIPQNIEDPYPEPLRPGTYTVGFGGDFPGIQSVFDKLSGAGILGEVTLELINTTYVALNGQYGFYLNGPIRGAGPDSRVIIKPASNKNVTIKGNREVVLSFINTKYLTIDGVALSGATTLTIHALENSEFGTNDCIQLINNSDHNIIQNVRLISEDITRRGAGVMIWNQDTQVSTPDSNLVQNNFIKKSGIAIFIMGYGIASTQPDGNIIRGNFIGSETDSLVAWGIQSQLALNTIIENNVVQNVRYYNDYFNVGINSYGGYGNIIRNNVVHNIYASGGIYGTTGILLSGSGGVRGSHHMVYNNMVYNIRSSATYGEATVAGIQMWEQNSPQIYYNTVLLSGNGNGANPDGSGALYVYSGCEYVRADNNVLVNMRDESPYCASSIYVYGYATMLFSDHNNLYCRPGENNCLVRATGSDYLTLSEWQVTGKDVNSISELPYFKDPDLHIKTRLQTGIDGNATPIPEITTDLDGDLRDINTPDIGADEFTLSWDTLYVPLDYTKIQDGIDAALEGDYIFVEAGTYYENINFKGKAITVASYFLLDGDESHIGNTVINGSQPTNPDTGSVVLFENGEDITSVLCGFTLTGGTGTYSWEYNDKGGGAIYLDSSGAKIIHNYITDNNVEFDGYSWGGGIVAYSVGNHNLVVENNIIINNSVVSSDWAIGGGLVLWNDGYASASIRNNKILDNSSAGLKATGGGLEVRGPINDVDIGCNLIKDNSVQSIAAWGGGGIYVNGCVPKTPCITNNIIIGNYTNRSGGGIYLDATATDLSIINRNSVVLAKQFDNSANIHVMMNNTIMFNLAGDFGGGLFCSGSLTEIVNSILWENTAAVGSQLYGNPHVNYCVIEGGYSPGEGNINLNPRIRDIIAGDYRLATNSPCIGSGIESIEVSGNVYCCPPFCYGGNPRPNPAGSIPDIGACELYLDHPVDVSNDINLIPEEFFLSQNYPNPFNPTTIIKYGLKEKSLVLLKVYDILGSEVASLINEEQDAGYYEINFNATKLSSGVYLYQISAGEFIETRKMILLK